MEISEPKHRSNVRGCKSMLCLLPHPCSVCGVPKLVAEYDEGKSKSHRLVTCRACINRGSPPIPEHPNLEAGVGEVLIPLTGTKGLGSVMLVEEEDRDFALQMKNHVDGNGYARRSADGKPVFFHRLILERKLGRALEATEEVDHIAPERILDNRRSNLRLADKHQSKRNRRKQARQTLSQYIGPTKERDCKRWRAKTSIPGQRVELGMFETELAAAHAYNFAALGIDAEFFQINKNLPPLPADQLAILKGNAVAAVERARVLAANKKQK